ncbi:Uncharacterised protein [Mycobacteroides abscessus subsp. abscessus]|nr:Uncharacterised protein [Mycobacteroides abscessus subsp. abscessus]
METRSVVPTVRYSPSIAPGGRPIPHPATSIADAATASLRKRTIRRVWQHLPQPAEVRCNRCHNANQASVR